MKLRIDHINLTVNNLDESTLWYQKVFGFEVLESGSKGLGSAWKIVGRDDTMICMTEYSGREAPYSYDLSPRHQINHFGLRIEDREQWEDIVKKNKLTLKYGGLVEYPKSLSWYITDPNGHEVEVNYSFNQALSFPHAK